jgi:spectinomycin phosphotransferase
LKTPTFPTKRSPSVCRLTIICTSQEEETLFYQGYGSPEINQTVLAYYRYERIVGDIAIYCEQLLSSGAGGNDREQSLDYLISNFHPASMIGIAYRSDRSREINIPVK